MNTIAIGTAVAATGLVVAIATHADSRHATIVDSRHATIVDGRMRACSVPVAVSPGYLPRALLVVENWRGEPVRIRLAGRAGSALPAVDFGTVDAGTERSFPNALPAGRNILIAARGEFAGEAVRGVVVVANRGVETCARRYLWRVE